MRKIDEAYEFIKKYLEERDYPPTIREIGDAIGIKSTSTVVYYLRKLEKENRIIKTDFKNRSIQLVNNKVAKEHTLNIITLPLINNLTMGKPILYENNVSAKYVFSGAMFKGFNMFLLPVKDNLMSEYAILKDDMVVVSRQNVAKNGEIVVAIIDGDYVISKISKEYEHYRLDRDKAVDTIYVTQLTILGTVVGVIRNKI